MSDKPFWGIDDFEQAVEAAGGHFGWLELLAWLSHKPPQTCLRKVVDKTAVLEDK